MAASGAQALHSVGWLRPWLRLLLVVAIASADGQAASAAAAVTSELRRLETPVSSSQGQESPSRDLFGEEGGPGWEVFGALMCVVWGALAVSSTPPQLWKSLARRLRAWQRSVWPRNPIVQPLFFALCAVRVVLFLTTGETEFQFLLHLGHVLVLALWVLVPVAWRDSPTRGDWHKPLRFSCEGPWLWKLGFGVIVALLVLTGVWALVMDRVGTVTFGLVGLSIAGTGIVTGLMVLLWVYGTQGNSPNTPSVYACLGAALVTVGVVATLRAWGSSPGHSAGARLAGQVAVMALELVACGLWCVVLRGTVPLDEFERRRLEASGSLHVNVVGTDIACPPQVQSHGSEHPARATRQENISQRPQGSAEHDSAELRSLGVPEQRPQDSSELQRQVGALPGQAGVGGALPAQGNARVAGTTPELSPDCPGGDTAPVDVIVAGRSRPEQRTILRKLQLWVPQSSGEHPQHGPRVISASAQATPERVVKVAIGSRRCALWLVVSSWEARSDFEESVREWVLLLFECCPWVQLLVLLVGDCPEPERQACQKWVRERCADALADAQLVGSHPELARPKTLKAQVGWIEPTQSSSVHWWVGRTRPRVRPHPEVPLLAALVPLGVGLTTRTMRCRVVQGVKSLAWAIQTRTQCLFKSGALHGELQFLEGACCSPTNGASPPPRAGDSRSGSSSCVRVVVYGSCEPATARHWVHLTRLLNTVRDTLAAVVDPASRPVIECPRCLGEAVRSGQHARAEAGGRLLAIGARPDPRDDVSLLSEIGCSLNCGKHGDVECLGRELLIVEAFGALPEQGRGEGADKASEALALESLFRSRNGNGVHVVREGARQSATVGDIVRALATRCPSRLHISTTLEWLRANDLLVQGKPNHKAFLQGLAANAAPHGMLECVTLSGSFSANLAPFICKEGVGVVVSWKTRVLPEVAAEFLRAFYDHLRHCAPYAKAFNLARAHVESITVQGFCHSVHAGDEGSSGSNSNNHHNSSSSSSSKLVTRVPKFVLVNPDGPGVNSHGRLLCKDQYQPMVPLDPLLLGQADIAQIRTVNKPGLGWCGVRGDEVVALGPLAGGVPDIQLPAQ